MALSIAKKQTSRLSESDFTNCPSSKGSDFTLSVQVGVHPRLRDYDQSFVPASESREVGFYFVAMDTRLLYFVTMDSTTR